MNFPVTSDGITPLMLACSFGNKIIMQVIIKNKMTDKEIID
jgi:ankyrin repeat protein